MEKEILEIYNKAVQLFQNGVRFSEFVEAGKNFHRSKSNQIDETVSIQFEKDGHRVTIRLVELTEESETVRIKLYINGDLKQTETVVNQIK